MEYTEQLFHIRHSKVKYALWHLPCSFLRLWFSESVHRSLFCAVSRAIMTQWCRKTLRNKGQESDQRLVSWLCGHLDTWRLFSSLTSKVLFYLNGEIPTSPDPLPSLCLSNTFSNSHNKSHIFFLRLNWGERNIFYLVSPPKVGGNVPLSADEFKEDHSSLETSLGLLWFCETNGII